MVISVIENILNTIDESNSFKRVDEKHVLNVYVGKDMQNMYTIIIRSKLNIKIPKSTNIIKIYKRFDEDINLYVFSITNNDYNELFIKMYDDIINVTRAMRKEDIALKRFFTRFLMWNRMFLQPNNTFLSLSQIIGLYGELQFLVYLVDTGLSIEETIGGWYGPSKDKKDFHFNHIWYEIKTTKFGSNKVKISSIEQLEDPMPGELIVYEYDSVSAESRLSSLYTLIEYIIDRIEDLDILDLFVSKLDSIGYSHDEYYKELNFLIKKMHTILIDEDVKVVRRSQLGDCVLDVSYFLLYRNLGDK
jgi:hypothetical protein